MRRRQAQCDRRLARPLSEEDTTRLLAALLERSVLPAEQQTALLRRVGGNPLYAEEYARMLADGDDDPIDVPETLQGVVAARIDALPDDEKALLQPLPCSGRCSGQMRSPR